uniref:Uncharacterized protein n=1 Tax=Tanacetum cinerariifolium TaxID=118510 RepID=A0A6L2J946_TANCI|nr:hypothetical protein [Tanacetum cinerariifolium]
MVKGEEDKESYASEFADYMLNDDVDDSGTRIELRSYKEKPYIYVDDVVSKKKNDEKNEDEVNNDDEEIKNEKKDDEIEKEKIDNDVEKTDEIFKMKDNNEVATDSMETMNEQMQTLIPTPTRSPRKDLSSYKTILEELMTTVSPTTATIPTPKTTWSNSPHIKNKLVTHEFFMSKIQEVFDDCNKDREVEPINVPEMVSKEFATHGPKMNEELFRKHMQNTTLNLYPTTSLSTAKKSTPDLQQ